MAKSYKNIIKNLKNYIENNHDYSIENDRFDIDDGQFGKKKCKNISEKEKENVSIKWMQNLDVYYSENTFLNEKVIFLRYESSDDIEKNGGYIILNTENINEFNSHWINDIATEVDMDLGIFLALFHDLESAPLINKLISHEEVDNILGIEYSDYEENHDYNEILTLFAPLYIFKIKDEYLCLDDNKNKYTVRDIEQFKYRFLGLIKCNYKIDNIKREVYLEENTINEYLRAFSQEIKNFPYENLYLSLCHNSPKFIFLEVYRMIEKLYPIIFCYHFRKDFGLKNLSLLDIQMKMQGRLKLRHREKDAIAHIFEYCIENKKMEKHLRVLNEYKNTIEDNSDISIDKWIYKIRNTAVHLSFDNKKDVDINKILSSDIVVKTLIPIVVELYSSMLA